MRKHRYDQTRTSTKQCLHAFSVTSAASDSASPQSTSTALSDVVATVNRRLEECAGVAVVVQCCVATNFVVVTDGGNESTAIAMRRFSLERGAEAGRKEGKKLYCVLCIEVSIFSSFGGK
jgi:hypothetical protein